MTPEMMQFNALQLAYAVVHRTAEQIKNDEMLMDMARQLLEDSRDMNQWLPKQ